MITAECSGDVWVLTLDRADKANALTREMLEALVSYVEAAATAKPAALILTGAGKVFSAGMDLDAARSGLVKDGVWERLSSSLAGLAFPTFAALNGTLAGGAFGMALACDIRIAVPGAGFFYPVMERGFLPQPSDPGRLCQLVGRARAAMILMAGAKIGAEEALGWGLVQRISDDPVGEATRLAGASCVASPEHRAAIKGMIV